VSRRRLREFGDCVQDLVDAWNQDVRIGDLVEFRNFQNDPPRCLRTRTAASILGGHTAVVWLEGVGGCVAIGHCIPVRELKP